MPSIKQGKDMAFSYHKDFLQKCVMIHPLAMSHIAITISNLIIEYWLKFDSKSGTAAISLLYYWFHGIKCRDNQQ